MSGGAATLLFFLFRRFGLPGVLVGGVALYLLSNFQGGGPSAGLREDARGAEAVAGDDGEEKLVQFVSFVLDDVQNNWTQAFASRGERYRLARLVLFRGATQSACGLGESAMGPFYCPSDGKVYLDLEFFSELRRRFDAAGDFAQAYVIAHELGHHVQSILGDSERVHRAAKSAQVGDDGLSVRLELQADCYAGVWGHSAQQRNLLDAGDLEEALRAASVIGDDALQKQTSGSVRPETFTHGSSAQRSRWFRRGFDAGSPAQCDTFEASTL
jgi:predicted metalloprotease